MKYNICFIGAGNLATNLSTELQKHGHKIVQVYSRSKQSAQSLASLLNTKYTTSTTEITAQTDVYVIALKDSAMHEVLSRINCRDKLLIHCSGGLPLSVLKEYSVNSGVLYPLQTFSKSREVDFSQIPVFVEGSSTITEDILIDIATSISKNVSVLNSEKRKSLHISAVFACNFVNHMYALAGEFLNSKNIPFSVLKPLIDETASKVQEMNPIVAQTGPAVRFDENIINAHLSQLKDFPEHQELYKSISKSIFNHHQEKNK